MTPAPKSAALIVLLIATLSTHEAAAQLVTWDGNGASPPNGIFSNALNWNPNQVPGLGDTVFFSANDTYTVTFVTFQANGTTAILGGTVSWLSNSATTQQDGIVNLVAGGGQSLTIGSSTKPVAVTVGAKILLGTGATSLDGTVNVVGANPYSMRSTPGRRTSWEMPPAIAARSAIKTAPKARFSARSTSAPAPTLAATAFWRFSRAPTS